MKIRLTECVISNSDRLREVEMERMEEALDQFVLGMSSVNHKLKRLANSKDTNKDNERKTI